MKSDFFFQAEAAIPETFAIGQANVLTVQGVYTTSAPIQKLTLLNCGKEIPVRNFGYPPYPRFKGHIGNSQHVLCFTADLFLKADDAGKNLTFALRAESGGAIVEVDLGECNLAARLPDRPVKEVTGHGEGPEVYIALATYKADISLLKRQVDSVRNQTHRNFVCVICDDASPDNSFEEIEEIVAQDARFVALQNPRNLGFYRNFERLLSLAPESSDFVCLCDQDDEWYPDKLATLISEFKETSSLIYSDMRLVTPAGEVLSPSFWQLRKNNFTNGYGIFLANCVTGAASMMRRSLLDTLLPFPQDYFYSFHDHWIGVCAYATGDIQFHSKPLYDYLQHGRNVIGHTDTKPYRKDQTLRRLLTSLRAGPEEPGAMVLLTTMQQETHLLHTAAMWSKILLERCKPEAAKQAVMKRFIQAESDPASLKAFTKEMAPVTEATLGSEWLLYHGSLARNYLVKAYKGMPEVPKRSRSVSMLKGAARLALKARRSLKANGVANTAYRGARFATVVLVLNPLRKLRQRWFPKTTANVPVVCLPFQKGRKFVAPSAREDIIAESYAKAIRSASESATVHGPAFVEYNPGAPEELRAKLLAFYLPQYHPFPENDVWWGRGFTEWTNVSKALPQYRGHYQPRLPGELGFYDLRLPEVQERQVELAKAYGIHGFAFYYYWFDGKRLLERPLDSFFANQKIDFPFCLVWANENWTRRWDGAESEVLMAQNHSKESDRRFIEDIAPYLRHKNYICIDGRPLVGVYRPLIMPDIKKTIGIWRTYCKENGLPDPYFVACQTFGLGDPTPYGFDAAVQFPPHHLAVNPIHLTEDPSGIFHRDGKQVIYSYPGVVAHAISDSENPDYPVFETAMPMWDNTARRVHNGHSFAYASPEAYRLWLEHLCRRCETKRDPYIFVNAWNEWGEGTYLEPDRRYGYAYLDATRDILRKKPKAPAPETLEAPESDLVFLDMGGLGLRSNSAEMLHAGFLGELEEVEKRLGVLSLFPDDTQRQLAVAKMVVNRLSAGQKLEIVLPIREPMARAVAKFFECIDTLAPNMRDRAEKGDVIAEELHELFYYFLLDKAGEQLFNFEEGGRFLSRHVKDVLGIDLLAEGMPTQQNHLVTRGNVRLAVTILERSADINEAAGKLLGRTVAGFARERLADPGALADVFYEKPIPEAVFRKYQATSFAQKFFTEQNLWFTSHHGR